MNSNEPIDEQEVVSWASMAVMNSANLAEKGYTRESRIISEMNFSEKQHAQKWGQEYLVEQLLYKAHV
jgi:hypothetical protein